MSNSKGASPLVVGWAVVVVCKGERDEGLIVAGDMVDGGGMEAGIMEVLLFTVVVSRFSSSR